MKEFIDKLIDRLEEKAGSAEQEMNYYRELSEEDASCEVFADSHKREYEAYWGAIDIVNKLAEEYKDKVIIDGQYCWQTCGATEHCKECNRLCNGSIDYFENYDVLAEEYNKKQEHEVWLNGCDDDTIFTMEMTNSEYEFLKRVSELANETSTYGCMPRLFLDESVGYTPSYTEGE